MNGRAVDEPRLEGRAAPADLHVLGPSRREQDVAGNDPISVRRLFDANLAQPVEALCEVACELLGHVLDDDDAGRVRGHGREHLQEGLRPPRARPNRDHGVGDAAEGPRGRRGGDRAHGERAARRELGDGRRLDLPNELFAEVDGPALDVELRLGDEVEGPELQRAEGRLAAGLGQRRDHDDGGGARPHELLEEGEPVHLGHLDVEGDDVGGEPLDVTKGRHWIGRRADDLDLGVARENVAEHAAHERRIIDDESSIGHRHPPPNRVTCMSRQWRSLDIDRRKRASSRRTSAS